MRGRPPLEVKSSQKVLHYMLSQTELMIKAWRSRIYFYSSATFLKLAGAAVIEWVNENPHLYNLRANCLQKLTDEDDLYELVGDAIVDFMKIKPLPFPHALFSKRHFWEVKVFKRAMVFVFLVRVVLQLKTPKQWKKYNVKDYKFNIRTFRYVMYPHINMCTVLILFSTHLIVYCVERTCVWIVPSLRGQQSIKS